jgi:drug/metabolite transporter (DMT)-like permease
MRTQRFYIHRMSRTRITAIVELTFAATLWGFGFIAAIWALRSFGPVTLTGYRFLIALVVGYLISFTVPSLRSSLTRDQFFLAMIPGLLVSALLVVQTWGLKYTTATKGGFITVLYVLIVPVLERVWLKRTLPRYHFIFVIFALIGMALICDLHLLFMPSALATTDPKQSWNMGDLLVLTCSFLASVHIIWFVFIQKRIRSSFVFNVHQSAWACLPALTFGLLFEKSPVASISEIGFEPWMGLASLAIGSTLIAFALQVKAQKSISPSLAALLFLLESPFAALFAIYFLNESLRTEHWAGAGLLLTAVATSTMFTSEANETELA